MEIRFSQYNEPFVESGPEGVHWLSLDTQRDIRAGVFDSHVRAFWQQPRTNIIEVHDHLSGRTEFHDISNIHYFPPFVSCPVHPISAEDLQFLDELFFDYGIAPAGKRSGRIKRASDCDQSFGLEPSDD